jgi:RNA polymerase sigma-70 factor (ECF subfamily)
MTEPEFREAYGQHKDMLYRFAWRMTGSPATAEDLVQDCFLILLRNQATLDRERGTLRSLLIGITRNLALKYLRGERPRDELCDESAICQPIDTDGRERSKVVARAVAVLPPLQREVLILAEYEELSLEEIARAVGAELAAVKSRLHRARENLRRMLAPMLEVKGAAHVSGK